MCLFQVAFYACGAWGSFLFSRGERTARGMELEGPFLCPRSVPGWEAYVDMWRDPRTLPCAASPLAYGLPLLFSLWLYLSGFGRPRPGGKGKVRG
jgi:hypothetical protein